MLIIQNFDADLRTLRKLILVNRFFFHVAIPLLLDSPAKKWDMTSEQAQIKMEITTY